MRSFYLALAALSLFLLLLINVVTFATSPEEATVSRLRRDVTQWQIEVREESPGLAKSDEDNLKKHVLGFFDQAGSPTYSKLEHYAVCLCLVFVFSAVGCLREACLSKRVQRD